VAPLKSPNLTFIQEKASLHNFAIRLLWLCHNLEAPIPIPTVLLAREMDEYLQSQGTAPLFCRACRKVNKSKAKPSQHLRTCEAPATYDQFVEQEFLVGAENIFKALLALGYEAEREWDAIKTGLESIKKNQLSRGRGSNSWAAPLHLWDLNY
jgi:hypothetical protein